MKRRLKSQKLSRRRTYFLLFAFLFLAIIIFYAGDPSEAIDLSSKKKTLYKTSAEKFWGERGELGSVDCYPTDVRIISGSYGSGEYGHATQYGAYKTPPDGSSVSPENYCRVFINRDVRQDSRQTCITFLHLYGHLLGKQHSTDIQSPMFSAYGNAPGNLYARYRKNILAKSLCKNLPATSVADDKPPSHPYDNYDFGEDDNNDGPGAIASRNGGPGGVPYDPDASIPDVNTRPKAADSVRIAKGQLGVREQPMGSNQTPNNKYNNNGQEWCAFFVTWVWQRAGVNVPTIGAVSGVEAWGRARGRYHSINSNYTPRPGDAALYGGGHIGIVTSVENGKIRMIDGNYGNRVQRHRSDRGLNLDYPNRFRGAGQGITGFVSPE